MAHDGIRLIEREPDLARYLQPEERALANRLVVPVRTLERGPFDLNDVLADARAFSAVILEGMMLQRMQVGSHLTMKMFGSGDVLARIDSAGSIVMSSSTLSATQDTSLALLGDEFLAAVQRLPALAGGLTARLGEQGERFGVQLAICQLPRVEERLLALLWWLAESWGRVTSVGTVLPLAMTHDVLGALIGARRPTVTLALGELSERGAIVRQDRGWLLLEPPPAPSPPAEEIDDPQMIPTGAAVWRVDREPRGSTAESHMALLESVAQLRAQHHVRTEEVRRRQAEMRDARERLYERRGDR